MDDLAKRLRKEAAAWDCVPAYMREESLRDLLLEAADEIDRLRGAP